MAATATAAARPHDDDDPVTVPVMTPLTEEELGRIREEFDYEGPDDAPGELVVDLLDEIERVKEERDTWRDRARALLPASTLATVK